MTGSTTTIDWVVLTMGNRPGELRAALGSLLAQLGDDDKVIVVANGVLPEDLGDLSDVTVVSTDRNLGVPGGRDAGVRAGRSQIVAFLDDDAVLVGDAARIRRAFDVAPRLAAVSLRLVDEHGQSSRRHVPRLRGSSAEESGPVAYFLGGASAIRRESYEEVGGFFTDLFYGHEEIELSWRLIDAGWGVRYLADVHVVHPRTEISRHADGWRLTGRNRVWIARRTLPWPIAAVHVIAWLVLGTVRAPDRTSRRSYVEGWLTGWRGRIDHRPIGWRGVWRLTRLGRPPVL